MSLTDKTLTGLSWSFIEQIATTGITFVIGIILARLISPEEFGIVGITTIFLTILPIFSDGGFGSALIQKKDCTEKDLSSVFYFNITISIICYLLLFLSAPFISEFFESHILINVIRVLGLNLIISAFGAVQNVVLTKKLDFKLLSKITVATNLSSGMLAIGLAYAGFGIWALVFRTIVQSLFQVALLFRFNNWYPKLIFDIVSIQRLFKFGSNLLISNIINKLFDNVFYFVIGKYYSPLTLGYYSRADMFKTLTAQNLNAVVQRVSFPVLSVLQDDISKLKIAYAKLIQNTMFLSCLIMFGMAASANAFVITLLGNNWEPTVPYLQLLCFSAFLYPIHALNLNIMNVKGRSDLFLKAEVLKKILLVPVIIVGIMYGIEWMLFGMIIFSFIAYFLNAGLGGPLISYTIVQQIKDVFPSALFALIVGGAMYSISFFIFHQHKLFVLSLQIIVGFCSVIILGEAIKFGPYLSLREIFISRFWSRLSLLISFRKQKNV